jgi:hypothetical protein
VLKIHRSPRRRTRNETVRRSVHILNWNRPQGRVRLEMESGFSRDDRRRLRPSTMLDSTPDQRHVLLDELPDAANVALGAR